MLFSQHAVASLYHNPRKLFHQDYFHLSLFTGGIEEKIKMSHEEAKRLHEERMRSLHGTLYTYIFQS
jgi:hypothetical protein